MSILEHVKPIVTNGVGHDVVEHDVLAGLKVDVSMVVGIGPTKDMGKKEM